MTLPRELRDMILRNVLITAYPLKRVPSRRSCDFWGTLGADLTADTDIMATCQQLRAQASDIFYTQNTFCFDCAERVSETEMGSKIRNVAHLELYDEEFWVGIEGYCGNYNLADDMNVKQLTIVLLQGGVDKIDPELFVQWLRMFKDVRSGASVSKKIKVVLEGRFQIEYDVTKVLAEVQAALDVEMK